MRYYVIINGVNSLTIEGLAIKTLPPISKPAMRNIREEIDGRDGDITTELGYGAYDKTLEIGLFGDYDINKIISFFNSKGTIIFSDEPDKYYNFEIVDKIDYTKLVKFRTATINIHCQPFKYPLNEVPLEEEYQYVEATGTDITLENTSENIFNKFDLFGNTSQTGTPTPSSPIPVNVVSGDNTINICGKNLLPTGTSFNGGANQWYDLYGNEMGTLDQIKASSNYIILQPNTTYKLFAHEYNNIATMQLIYIDSNNTIKTYVNSSVLTGVSTFTTTEYTKVWLRVKATASAENTYFIGQLEKSNQATAYEPYIGNSYPISLGVENLLEPKMATTTQSGITCTNNGDGSFTLNGTATGGIAFRLDQSTYNGNDNLKNYNGTYTLSCNELINGMQLIVMQNQTWNFLGRMLNSNTPNTFTADKDNCFIYVYVESGITLNNLVIKPQLEKGSKANSFSPYGTTPIELCKIGTYQDYIYKDNGSWYLHKEIGKVVLNGSENWTMRAGSRVSIDLPSIDGYYVAEGLCDKFKYIGDWDTHVATNYSFIIRNGNWGTNLARISFIDTDYTTVTAWKQYVAENNITVYYQLLPKLGGATNTEITDTTLIEQLESLSMANSIQGQTNISQTNNDMPFILDLSALKEGSDHLVINNAGNIYAKPTMDLEGTGVVDIYLNDVQILEADLSETNNIVIDTEAMEAYNPDTNALANRQVTGDYSKIKLEPGENDLRFSGDLSKATITDYTRWL